MRFFLMIAVLIVVGLLLRRALRQNAPPPAESRGEPPSEAMVQCRACGVFLPGEEALKKGAFHYCCEDHRQQDRVD